MCLQTTIVIVIVKTRDSTGLRIKYINVRKERRMVAQLPQQVFLLFVLVSATMAGSVYEPELLDRTSESSNRKPGGASPRLSDTTSLKGLGTSGRSSGRRILVMSDDPKERSLKIESAVSTDLGSVKLASSISDPKSYKRKRIKDDRDETDTRKFRRRLTSRKIVSKDNSRVNEKHSDDSKSRRRCERCQDEEGMKRKALMRREVEEEEEEEERGGNAIITRRIRSSPEERRRNVFSNNPASSGDPSASWSSSPFLDGDRNSGSIEMSFNVEYEKRKINQDTSRDGESSGSFPAQFLNFGTEFQGDERRNFEDSPSDMSRGDGNAPLFLKPSVKRTLQMELRNSTEVLISEPTPPSRAPRRIIYLGLDGNDSDFRVNNTSAGTTRDSITTGVTKLAEKEDEVITEFRTTTDQDRDTEARHFDIPPPYFSLNIEKNKLDAFISEAMTVPITTWSSNTAVGFSKRYARDAEPDPCEKFLITDDVKREFYSPNYPQNYPPKINCVRTLEAEKGMLLKLDFRDRFELEAMTLVSDKVGECRFDYLEVRDGQYGFSNLLGIFCDKNFPPEIISKSRYLWLHFHSDDTIEYQGFKAVWSTIPRPTSGGVPPEQEPCFRNVTIVSDLLLGSDDVKEEKKLAEQYKVALDCLWAVTVPADSRLQMTFDGFKLDKPNDCSANFLDIFEQNTDIPSRIKNFCGSMSEPVHTTKNTMYIRLYLEPKAINSSFASTITAVREKSSTDKPCRDNEYDCDDNTCIALSLRCNKRPNCRFLRDEDTALCGMTDEELDSSRVIIILVIFSLIMFGMCFAFIFNCVRKLIRDHRIIREYIRQSRENRLDEIGRKTTPCPVSFSRTDLREHGSESPSVEIDSSKELIPAGGGLLGHDYTKELVLEMKYGSKNEEEMNDIHQSNNVRNATQERLHHQESSEELEMCDSACQTRESLFEVRISPLGVLSGNNSPSGGLSSFGFRRGSELSTRKIIPPRSEDESYRHNHNPQHIIPRKYSSNESGGSSPRHPVSKQCSVCQRSVSSEASPLAPICPQDHPIPAPPGWSIHDPPYDPDTQPLPEDSAFYKRYQSPKPEIDFQRQQSPIYAPRQRNAAAYPRRQNSGERYDSLIYGSAGGSSGRTGGDARSDGSSASPKSTPVPGDPSYRAEAVIELDQLNSKRPFSIESTKSAPDVIATH